MMAERSKIEWTDHSWNPWFGCDKVSAGCDFCYAERLSNRFKSTGQLGIWGPDGERKPSADSAWELPLKWNRRAEASGVRERVFPHLCDPFEDREELVWLRMRFFALIYRTQSIDWLILTKRPENILKAVKECLYAPMPKGTLTFSSEEIKAYAGAFTMLKEWLHGSPPPNVWLGTSVENQEVAEARIPELLKVPAAMKFLSCEPLLGFVHLANHPGHDWLRGWDHEGNPSGKIDWVIVGGESGPSARPMHPDWARGLRDQCQATGVPFFFKQWGEWQPRLYGGHNPKTDFNWCEGADGREKLPFQWMCKVGKTNAGRLLDGETWEEFPKVKEVANG